MKHKILFAALSWVFVITGLHLHLNVGWAQLMTNVRVLLGRERHTLEVGFIPAT